MKGAQAIRSQLAIRTAVLGDFRKWVVIGVAIGTLVGLAASLFLFAIDGLTHLLLGGIAGLTPPLPSGEGSTTVTAADRPWLFPLVVALGGLLSAVIVYWLAPDAEGGGTDAAIRAFHDDGGRVRRRVAPIKLIASAIVLGSGGSAGREGPSAHIGAGIASWVGDIFALSAEDRRIAAAVGLGAGIGAIFRAPLGGAILGAELLYTRDFEIEAIVPGFIASVIGYSIVGAFYGFTPIFGHGLGLRFEDPRSLGWYALLGVLCGLVAIAYARVFYATRAGFRNLAIPRWLKPALGGLAVGIIALAFPQVLSIGYGWLQLAIDGNHAELATWTMLALVGVKIIATSLTIGSGGSGGDFAPVLYVGGMLGGGVWGALHNHVPGMPSTPAPFVIVGMMALLGGAANAPLAVMIMVAEMTGEFSMLVPAMIAAGLAYFVSGETTLYEEQRRSRADSPAHRAEYSIPLIQSVSVGEAMRREITTTTPGETVAAAEQLLQQRAIRGMPVLHGGKLAGMFTMTDALRATRMHARTVGEVMQRNVVVAHPAESLHTALQRMTNAGISRLPVVEREAPDRVVGIVSMREIASVLDLRLEELRREPGAARPDVSADDPLLAVAVQDAMRTAFDAVEPSLSLKRVASRLSDSGAHALLVVDESGALVGVVTARDIERSLDEDPERPVSEVMHSRVITARPAQSIADALAQPGARDVRQLVVVDRTDAAGVARPIGMLARSDVVAAYLRVRDREARAVRRARSARRGGEGAIELRVRPATDAAGRTLSELRLPRGALVTRIERDGTVIVPDGSVRLEPGDRLQIAAADEIRPELLRRFTAIAAENEEASEERNPSRAPER